MDELIARLAKAEKGSHALDVSIYEIAAPAQFRGRYWDAKASLPRDMPADEKDAAARQRMRPPTYTASIDAALTLVPEGFPLNLRALNVEGDMEYGASIDYGPWCESTASLALALVIACLRARSTQERG